jgi:hypothetical protein
MLHPTPESALQLGKLRAEQLVREAEAERRYREARSGAPHPVGEFIALARAALQAIAREGQHRTPSPVDPAQTRGSGAGLPVAKPAAS